MRRSIEFKERETKRHDGTTESALRPAPANRYAAAMIELLRSNDAVLISFVEALLKEAAIDHAVLDRNMSVIEGSLGILPRRVLVAERQEAQARRILAEAGLAGELS